jgi:5'(3')-deoxyribonucleotidase
MRTKPRVLLDVDGVLADFAGAWIDLINAERHPDLTPIRREDLNEWEIFDALEKSGTFNEKELARLKKTCHDETARKGFCASLKVIQDAEDNVRKLMLFAEVFIVTSPWHTDYWVNERSAWVQRHFGIPRSNVMHGSAKHICAGDFLIDDKTSTVVKWAQEAYNGRGIVFATPHNVNDPIPSEHRASGSIVRTDDWSLILRMVCDHVVPA